MITVEVDGSNVKIDAALIAEDLGLRPEGVLEATRAGRLTAVHEQGVAEDAGRVRMTFYHGNRRLRLTLDETGRVIERSRARLHASPRKHVAPERD